MALYLWNLQRRRAGLGIRASWSRQQSQVRLEDAGITWFCLLDRLHLYASGLQYRATQIGRAYLLGDLPLAESGLVVDCGANMGDLALFLHFSGRNNMYLGIEASPREFRCLNQNVSSLGGRALKLAASNNDGMVNFYSDSGTASGSIIRGARVESIFSVKARRLDSLLATGTEISLIKIDAEGAEPEVLAGASAILASTHFIAADVGPERGANELSTEFMVHEVLSDAGFVLAAKNRYHRQTVLYEQRVTTNTFPKLSATK